MPDYFVPVDGRRRASSRGSSPARSCSSAGCTARTRTSTPWRRGTIALIIADGLDIVSAILAILVVRIATDRLKGRAAEQATPREPDEPSAWNAPERPAGAPA